MLATALFALGFATGATAQTGVTFSKSFAPGSIGPGSVTTLTFTISSELSEPVTDLAFTDTLPAGVTIADPNFASDGCDGSLSAPEGGGTITFSDGVLEPTSSCQISVDVTSTTIGDHQNVSGDLTSSAGNSGQAVATLTVDSTLPGFSKAFDPVSVQLGGGSTLPFTLDNTINESALTSASFTDTLPTGMVIADPPNAATDCGEPGASVTLTANGGDNELSFSAFGANFDGARVLAAGATCTITVDITATGVGTLDNRSSSLNTNFGAAGKASDALEATADDLALVKAFTDDPLPPGGTGTLEFSIFNFERSETVTDITFSDDLDATLAGLVAVGLPQADVCGAGSSLEGTSPVTLTGGNLGPGESCTFEVTVQVPAGATPGTFPNTTSTITGTLGGTEISGSPAADDLVIDVAPVLTKTFLDNPVGAGGSTDLEFTITNTSASSAATDIAFTDDLGAVIPGLAATALPADGFCGAGSTITGTSILSVSGANLAPAGDPGDTCTFQVTVDVPDGIPSGTFTNTTSEITATVDDATRTGPPASDDLDVAGAPVLRKEFTDDPVDPGGTATLEFTLIHDEFAPAGATDIAFTDDLDATLAGLTATGLPLAGICGPDSSIDGTSVLSFNGGALAPGESCTFDVTVQVPAEAPAGSHANTTNAVTATVDGLSTTGSPATDDLRVSAVSMAKTFVDDPVIPGGNVVLSFTVSNDNPDADATDIFFEDDLESVLPGLQATDLPQSDVCGAGSLLEQLEPAAGEFRLRLSGGSLTADTQCTFDTTLTVPAGTNAAVYTNTTQNASSTIDGSSIPIDNAQDDLIVDTELLALTKEFTDDPGIPGGTVTLQFTLTNISDTETIDSIAFSDDLDAVFAGLVSESGTQADVCGAGSELSGTSVLMLTGGQLGPTESCIFSATLRIPDGASGNATNTTSGVTGSAGGLGVEGLAASDTLRVNNVAFSKAFSGPTTATGTVTLSFVLDNLDTDNGVNGLAFSDDLDAVIPGLAATGTPVADVCGAGSELDGTSVLTLTGADLGPGGSCAFDVVLQVPATAEPGSFNNTTSELLANGLLAANPASASLQIEPPPTFGKVFMPNAIAVDGTSTLTFTIDNTGSAVAASGLDFTDDLPAGLVVAATPNASTTCGGTLTATPGAGVLSFSGGSVAASDVCTVQVDITGTAEGTFDNVSGVLTSSSGDSGTAADTIDVVTGDFVVTKSFRTEPVLPAGLVEMELSIVNGSDFPLTDIELSDNLDATLTGLAAEGLPQTDVCGAGSTIDGAATVTLTGGNLAAGGSCTVVVDVRVPADAPTGTFTNTTSVATGVREGVDVEAPADSADLVVEPLAFTKTLDPTIVAADSTVTATFSITNPDPANGVTALAFSDDLDAFVPGMTATNTPLADVCGAGSTLDGGATIALAGGTLAGSGSCTFDVTLDLPAGTAAGDFTNTTSDLTAEVDATATSVPAASAALSVQPPPGFTKAFSPASIGTGDISTLTFVIDNTASQLDADSLAFTDNLPAALDVAATPAASNGCGGTLTADAGTGVISLSGGSVAQGTTCQIQVDVTADSTGGFTNVSGDLTSSLGNSGPATAELAVTSQPAFSKAFDPAVIDGGQTSVLTLTIDNTAQPEPADDLAFTDDLPAGITLADNPNATTDCTGGILDAPAGGTTIAYSGGSVGAGVSCTVSATVTSSVPGDHENVSGDLTSSLGNSGNATATLSVADDTDGVPASVEDGAPNDGDGNNDGIPDRIQDSVASLPAVTGAGFITVTIVEGCAELNNVATATPGSQGQVPGDLDFPFGLVGFEMPCENATVDVTFHGAGPGIDEAYYKFGPTTPGDPATAGWFDFSNTGAATGATASGNVWTLVLADNQLGDATGDDGVIVDPGGPANKFIPVPLFNTAWVVLLALLLAAFAWRTMTVGAVSDRDRF